MEEKYLETFTNEYGETWWFNYDNKNDMGILWGNDDLINGKVFYIFDGKCPKLILNKEERNWIKDVWSKYSKNKNTYLNLPTEIKYKYSTYLTNNYCPICLKERDSFEHHHCIPASIGGSDDYVNMLVICNTCHSLITNGCEEDSYIRFICAVYHQLYLYGIDFCKMNPLNNKRFKNQDMGLCENVPHIKTYLEKYDKFNDDQKILFNNKIKKDALYHYKYYRSAVNNIIQPN